MSVRNNSMANIDKEQRADKNPTKVVIITSVDDDNEKILSYFNSSNVETMVVDLNQTNLMDAYQLYNKQSLTKSEKNSSIKISKNTRKRKADLTCVVCGAEAIGYNFAQITCESCKAFFRRNAIHPIEKTRCIKYKDNLKEIRCDVHHDVKHKCQRCRLLKCFHTGMRKDYILTPEEKQSKKQRLEENRQLRSNDNTTERIVQPKKDQNHQSLVNIPLPSSSSLSKSDWLCLSHIQNAYFSASQSSPSASSVISFELSPDKMSAFMNTIDIQNFTAVKLINFLRDIPEFEQLDEHDRLILVKYNLTLLFLMRHSLAFDSTREICYDLDTPNAISPTDEAFAQHYKSLFILCYGYKFNRVVMSILHVLTNLVNKDSLIIQLLMLIMIFSKGLSADDDQEPILNDEKSVFNAQSKYTDLLFRYLMESSSFEIVAVKMTRITEQLLKIQKVSRDFQQYLKDKVDITYINPLMKSLLHLT